MPTIDLAMAVEHPEEIYQEMVALLSRIAPQVEPLGTPLGVLSQVDNWCAAHLQKSEPRNIIPVHKPMSLLKEAVRKCEGGDVVAAHVALLARDGGLWSDACGESSRELVWALALEQHRLLSDAND